MDTTPGLLMILNGGYSAIMMNRARDNISNAWQRSERLTSLTFPVPYRGKAKQFLRTVYPLPGDNHTTLLM